MPTPRAPRRTGRASSFAQEQRRDATGTLTTREFGPPSPASQRLARTMRRTVAPTVALWRPTPRGLRIAQRTMARAPIGPILSGTRVEHRVLGGVPIEWTVAPRAESAAAGERVILLLHGGGYVIGSARQYRPLSARVSHVTSTPVASVDYRLVPAVRSIQDTRADALAAYRGLLEAGYAPESIVVLGDSAGGGLASYVALSAIAEGLGRPAAVALLSPWVDMTEGGHSRLTNRSKEIFIGGDVLDRISRALVPDPAERAFWHNSAINAPAELLAAMPPTLIQVSDVEVLTDDALTMAERLRAAEVPTELQTFAGQGHVVALWSGIPEARRALQELARWLRATLPDDRRPQAVTDAALDVAVGTPSAPPAAGLGL